MYEHSFSMYVHAYEPSYLGSTKTYVCTYDTDPLGNRAVHMYNHMLYVIVTYTVYMYICK